MQEFFLHEHALIHLAHFMEAAFGLNIAFTIVDDVHQWGKKTCLFHLRKKATEWRKIESQISGVSEPRRKTENDPDQHKDENNGRGNSTEGVESLFASNEIEFSDKLESKISTQKVISFGIGIWFYCLLAYAGFNYEQNLSFISIILIIAIPAFVPIFFTGWIFLQWRGFFKKLLIKAEFVDEMVRPSIKK